MEAELGAEEEGGGGGGGRSDAMKDTTASIGPSTRHPPSQERDNCGNQVPIYSSPSYHQLLYKM